MDTFDSKFNFNLLSLKDLVEARDLFHLHLINKRNVVATALGRYRIRKKDPWPNETMEPIKGEKEKRTLENSEVRDYSWPCIQVFVKLWEKESELCISGANEIIPKRIYMPDGRIIPICVIVAPKSNKSDSFNLESNIVFPNNFIGGGFSLITQQQGSERIGSIGCIVTDGNKYYALTSRHVTGEKGTPIFTKMKGKKVKIGISSGREIGKADLKFSDKAKKGNKTIVNHDVGLVEIADINRWKTDIFGLGQMEEIADLNSQNLSLTLITSLQIDRKTIIPKVKAFGAVSGLIEGEIIGLFYRYKSLGGIEYVSDFLIGGNAKEFLNIHHGDSGMIWFIETENGYRPFAVHWGQHNFIISNQKQYYPLGLASNLTNVCVGLDVDIVRGWNLDNDYSWGKTGHFKIAALACELVSNKKLRELLLSNQKNIGYSDDELIKGEVINGIYSSAKEDFVPLADVADIIWRWTRKNSDEANHYCDVDETNIRVSEGQSLLTLCSNPQNIDIDFWLKYYMEFDSAVPNYDTKGNLRPRDGALPFRVWQMYNGMVSFLKNNEIAKFICAGGTMSHYVADACNSLHISYMHHGRDDSEKNVHTDYENKVVDKNKAELFSMVNDLVKNYDNSTFIIGGSGAAKVIIDLMEYTKTKLPPESICNSFSNNIGNRKRIDNMWNDLKDGTADTIAQGCKVMAALWESAWIEGNGDNLNDNNLGEIDPDDLKTLYNDKTFVPSFRIDNPKFKEALK